MVVLGLAAAGISLAEVGFGISLKFCRDSYNGLDGQSDFVFMVVTETLLAFASSKFVDGGRVEVGADNLDSYGCFWLRWTSTPRYN